MSLSSPFLTSIAILIFTLTIYAFKSRNTTRYPPGLPTLPFVGNQFSLPTRKPWETYLSHCGRSSDVISVWALGQLTVVINSKTAAKELLERRSAIYSDRPTPIMIKLLGWDFNLAWIPYSDKWRVRRRILHENFHAQAVLAYRPLQKTKIRGFLKGVWRDPEQFGCYIRIAAGAIAMFIAYGQGGGDPEDDKFVRAAEDALSMLSYSVFPGATAVNVFPFLRYLPGWLPGMGFKPFAARCTELTTNMKNAPWDFVKQGMADGTAGPSMASTLINRMQESPVGEDDEQAAKDACAITYVAGADTTVSAVSSAVLALLLNPKVQRCAQTEIDKVVGRDRLPEFEDRPAMPYSEAVYREVLRWILVAPLSVPRAAFDDDTYEGYFIPKGQRGLSFNSAMMHNPEEYPDPEAFKPERYLTPDGRLTDDDMKYAFGFGRRQVPRAPSQSIHIVCSGLHLADSTVWMIIVSFLSVFDIVPAKDKDGHDILAEVDCSDGVVSHPFPFQCVFRPRDKAAEALLTRLRDTDSED
ncbi:cytochrome P450 [Dentipellis sp. KUC8613]|nr:cytochrome P450 [Dentipellis sp. KUC8613]